MVPIEYDVAPYEQMRTRMDFPYLHHSLVYGVYFICCIGEYKQIVAEQLYLIRKSGLLRKTDTLFCFICKFNPEIMEILEPYQSKLKIIFTTENLYERYALNNFRSHITTTSPYYLYYFHTKGVSRSANVFHDTRRNLDYFILDRHEICMFWLDNGYDAVGTSLSLYPSLHFSGNFWWARSSHLDRLPREISKAYYASEMYVCGFPMGKYISVCQTTNKKQREDYILLSREEILHQSTCVPHNNVACKNMRF